MIGGGVPKNFAQDFVVAAEILTDADAPMHKYAVQITVADVRDGAPVEFDVEGSFSWGKVDTVYEQMVFSEATSQCRSSPATRITRARGRTARARSGTRCSSSRRA
jgi:deoxyhypusine synthase